jgi:hypothetical protein
MTQCKTKLVKEQGQMSLNLGIGKLVEAEFDGERVCSDGGLLLLRKADQRLDLTELAALCFADKRRPDLVKHNNLQMLRQRVYAIAAGYEDCNDANFLATDPMHQLALGFRPDQKRRLASQPTLSRFENSVDEVTLKALQKLLVHIYVKQSKKKPKVLRLSMDTTCDEVHGFQQLSFYNGFYETACYTPLFIFADDAFPLCALLRAGNASPAEGGMRMLRQVVQELRLSWTDVRIELTADAGFAVPELYEYCEANGITYYIGTRGHNGLGYHAEPLMLECKKLFEEFGCQSAPFKKYGFPVSSKETKKAWRQRQEHIRFSSKEEGRMQEHFEYELSIRRYCDFMYRSREWSKFRRHIGRCHYTNSGPDMMYVVTNATGNLPQRIYEEKYCKRARCENWIKEIKNHLKCDRTSCQEFNANQFRLLLHTFAYILLWRVQQKAKLTQSNFETLRLGLIKVGVIVKETARRIRLRLASESPWQEYFRRAWIFL